MFRIVGNFPERWGGGRCPWYAGCHSCSETTRNPFRSASIQDGAGLRFSVARPGKEADKRETIRTLVSRGVGRKQPLFLVSWLTILPDPVWKAST